jgi:hypothetical protein
MELPRKGSLVFTDEIERLREICRRPTNPLSGGQPKDIFGSRIDGDDFSASISRHGAFIHGHEHRLEQVIADATSRFSISALDCHYSYSLDDRSRR